jgi:hypothetical protein
MWIVKERSHDIPRTNPFMIPYCEFGSMDSLDLASQSYIRTDSHSPTGQFDSALKITYFTLEPFIIPQLYLLPRFGGGDLESL